MGQSSLAPCAQESSELVECFRHEDEECSRCETGRALEYAVPGVAEGDAQ
jgi:hypothetical protein